ncbi:MAG: hypothetical protein H6Q43_3259, partial [Deltaproteobacteria bacterium]|nr:hypothetical protein [Deltaproteobacteria bacterium]
MGVGGRKEPFLFYPLHFTPYLLSRLLRSLSRETQDRGEPALRGAEQGGPAERP